MATVRILVVEDEPSISDFIERGLKAEGFAVSVAADGSEGEIEALNGDYGLVLLDVLLPKKDGIAVLASIRAQRPGLPVIMLTALGETEDKVRGLEEGAIDYVTKPFSFEELLARIRAQLRRPSSSESGRITFGGLSLDQRTRRVHVGEDEIGLTAREFALLAYFMEHPDQVLSKTQILNAVWGYDYDPGTNVVEVYVGYLRKKLGNVGTAIETVRGSGYRLGGKHA